MARLAEYTHPTVVLTLVCASVVVSLYASHKGAQRDALGVMAGAPFMVFAIMTLAILGPCAVIAWRRERSSKSRSQHSLTIGDYLWIAYFAWLLMFGIGLLLFL